RDFHGTDLASLSWVLNAYAIVFAALLVPAGRAADLIGRRAAFLTGMVVFGLASAACAVAPDVWVLVAARVVQAAGGALLMPASLGLLLAAARAEKRAGTIRARTPVGGAAARGGAPRGALRPPVRQAPVAGHRAAPAATAHLRHGHGGERGVRRRLRRDAAACHALVPRRLGLVRADHRAPR